MVTVSVSAPRQVGLLTTASKVFYIQSSPLASSSMTPPRPSRSPDTFHSSLIIMRNG